jgi:hypothetical protein
VQLRDLDMKKVLLFLTVLLTSSTLQAQVSINSEKSCAGRFLESESYGDETFALYNHLNLDSSNTQAL